MGKRRHRRRRSGNLKAQNQMEHAGKRAWERLGFDFHHDRQVRAVKQIQAGDAEFIRRDTTRVTVWWVEIDGVRLRVLYDKLRKTIVTVLPPEDSDTYLERKGVVREDSVDCDG